MNIQTAESNLSRPRPVLMTPIRRCGSHALRLRLNLSPDFYSPYPKPPAAEESPEVEGGQEKFALDDLCGGT